MATLTYIDLDQPEADWLVSRYAAPEDHAAAARHQRPLRRRQSLAARALLRASLAEIDGRPPAEWRIALGPNGAPHLLPVEGAPPPCVSISHSNRMVACAVGRSGRIGVDIEYARLDRPYQAIAAAIFGPDEIAQVTRLGAAGFYAVWTRREALAKATGAGFPLVVNRIDLVSAEPKPVRIHWDGVAWTLGHWVLPGNYSLAVAVEDDRLPEPKYFAPR